MPQVPFDPQVRAWLVSVHCTAVGMQSTQVSFRQALFGHAVAAPQLPLLLHVLMLVVPTHCV